MQLLPAFNNHHRHHHLDLCDDEYDDDESHCHHPLIYFGPFQVINLCSSSSGSSILVHVKTVWSNSKIAERSTLYMGASFTS